MELKISKKFLFNSLILIVYCQNKLCAKLLQKISCWYDQSFFAIFQNDGTYPTSTCLDWYFQHFYIHQSKALKENTSTDSYMKSVTIRSRFIVCILLNWEETVSPTLTRQHLDNLWWRKIFIQQFKLLFTYWSQSDQLSRILLEIFWSPPCIYKFHHLSPSLHKETKMQLVGT